LEAKYAHADSLQVHHSCQNFEFFLLEIVVVGEPDGPSIQLHRRMHAYNQDGNSGLANQTSNFVAPISCRLEAKFVLHKLNDCGPPL
jgi:hypothetical protein